MSYDTSGRDEVQDEHVERDDGYRFEGLTTSVGAFLVLGVGFVFTMFFVGQFAGDSGGFGAGVGLFGGAGLSFAVLLSPLLALFVGVLLGESDNPDAARDAGVGSALGFVVMFFVTLVVATSIQPQEATVTTGSNTIGPLAGYTIGVGLTAAAAAAITGSEDTLVAPLTDHSLGRPVAFGLGSFLAYGVGYTLTVFLADALGPGETGVTNSTLLVGIDVPAMLGIGLLFAPVVGILVGTLGTRDGVDETEAATGSGVASALGAVLLLVVVYGTILVVEPGGTPAGDFPFGLLVGLLVGTGLTGAGAGYVSANN